MIEHLIEKYIGEADRHLSMWAKETTKDGKKGKLIGYWDDLTAYYAFGNEMWSYSSRKWSNMGSTPEEFKKQMKKGDRWRGKLIESKTDKTTDKTWSRGIDWQEFFDASKEKNVTPSTFKDYEKKYSGYKFQAPHIQDALKKSKDFNTFMKMIKKFEK